MKKGLFPSHARLQQAVLNSLATLGGEAGPSNLYPLVTAYFEAELTPEALTATLKRGDNKWQNYIRWQREDLRKKGIYQLHSEVSGNLRPSVKHV